MKTPEMTITLEDNMDLMARYEDNYFDLAIVDPPYMENIEGYMSMQKMKGKAKKKIYTNGVFKKPNIHYWSNLFRISKNQIVWGINHFSNFGAGRVIWDKNMTGQFNDAEIAYQSLSNSVRIFKYTWNGMLQKDMKNKEIRIHPTQKPVALYEWLFKNYAKEGDKILDTHLGSGSIAIALHRMNQIEKMNLTLTACELDPDYYKDAIKRIKQQTAQMTIF